MRGLIFLGVTSACIVLGLDLHGVVEDAYAPLEPSVARGIAFAIPGVLTYILALVDAYAGGTSE